MKDLKLLFENLKPPSNNNLFATVGKRRIKSKAYRLFEAEVLKKTQNDHELFFDFETQFSPYEHCLHCNILILIPRLLTAKGTIAKRKHDVANFEKSISDSIFKNFVELDDSYITRLQMEKHQSHDDEWHFFYKLHISNLDEIRRH